MKQKIVMKVHMKCQKCRTKARKIAASSEGVEEMKLEGEDQVVVIGDGVDPVRLVNCLRRRVGHTCIISVDEVKPPPPPPPPKKKPEDKPKPTHCDRPQLGFQYYYHPPIVVYEPVYEPMPSYNCSVM